MVRRWYDYWMERPGTGLRVSNGGMKIIFSDTNTHNRGESNYRTSGVVDAMRLHVRNTTNRALTTPFELFTNTPADTAWFDQGDYIAYANATLPPYGRLVIPLYALWEFSALLVPRATDDDEAPAASDTAHN